MLFCCVDRLPAGGGVISCLNSALTHGYQFVRFVYQMCMQKLKTNKQEFDLFRFILFLKYRLHNFRIIKTDTFSIQSGNNAVDCAKPLFSFVVYIFR